MRFPMMGLTTPGSPGELVEEELEEELSFSGSLTLLLTDARRATGLVGRRLAGTASLGLGGGRGKSSHTSAAAFIECQQGSFVMLSNLLKKSFNRMPRRSAGVMVAWK